MSIGTINDKILNNRGCATTVAAVMLLGMVAGMFYSGTCQGPAGTQASDRSLAATVNGTPLHADTIEKLHEQQVQQFAQQMQGMPLSATMDAQVYARSLMGAVDGATIVSIAKKEGASFGDTELKAAASSSLDQALEGFKAQLVAQNQLKPNATEAEFAAAFERFQGRTLASVREDQAAQVEAALKDSSQRSGLEVTAANSFLLDKAKANLDTSEAAIKATFNTYEYQRILFKDAADKPGSAKETAAKVASELAAKTLTFEQAMDRYSADPPAAGKRVSEGTNSIMGSVASTRTEMAPLLTLKVGEVSAPTDTPEGIVIYRLKAINNNAPADLAKDIARYRTNFVQARASEEVRKMIEAARKDRKIEWKMNGYKALFDVAEAASDPAKTADVAKGLETMTALFAEAEAAKAASVGPDLRAASVAAYLAIESVWPRLSAEQRATLREKRIASIEGMLEGMESAELRMQLVDLFIEEKKGDEAVTQLLTAAQNNSDLSQMGLINDAQIATTLQRLESAKLITPEQKQEIAKERARWKSEFDEQRKNEEQARQEEEKARRQAEAEEKAAREKAKAEAKNKTEAPKDGGLSPNPTPAPAPGGSLFPGGGGQ